MQSLGGRERTWKRRRPGPVQVPSRQLDGAVAAKCQAKSNRNSTSNGFSLPSAVYVHTYRVEVKEKNSSNSGMYVRRTVDDEFHVGAVIQPDWATTPIHQAQNRPDRPRRGLTLQCSHISACLSRGLTARAEHGLEACGSYSPKQQRQVCGVGRLDGLRRVKRAPPDGPSQTQDPGRRSAAEALVCSSMETTERTASRREDSHTRLQKVRADAQIRSGSP
jgi:hypothetical protein